MNSINTKEYTKDSIILLADKAKFHIYQNKHLLEITDIFKQQISKVKNLITNYSLNSNLDANDSIDLALRYRNQLLSLNSKLKEEINANLKKREINFNNVSENLSMNNQTLSQLDVDNFILNNTINKYNSQIKSLSESLEASKRHDLFREHKRDTEIDIKESKNIFLVYNLECQQKMLSYCRYYAKYKYKNLKKREIIKIYKKQSSILKDTIKYYSSKLYGDEIKVLNEINKQEENKKKKKVDIRKRIVTLPSDKKYKFLGNFSPINKLNELNNKYNNDDNLINKYSLFKEDNQNIFTEIKEKQKENNSERKKINILKIDELLDIENIEVEDEDIIDEELNSDDEVFFEKKVKPKKKLSLDFLPTIRKQIPLINLSQIEFNKLKVINEADAYSLQKRNFEQNNINGKIKNLNKQIKNLERRILMNIRKIKVIQDFIEDVKYNYKLLRPIKVQTSAAGNPVNYIREKLLNIVEETINESEKKDKIIYSDNKYKTGKTAVEEGEENDEELVGSDYSNEDEYIGNDDNKEYHIENKEEKNDKGNDYGKNKKNFNKNKEKNNKIKTNLISKFDSDEKEENKKIIKDKTIYQNKDVFEITNAQSK